MLKKLFAAIFCTMPLQFTAVNAMKGEKNLYEVTDETKNKISAILENIKSKIMNIDKQLVEKRIPNSDNIIPNEDKIEMLNKMKELAKFITSDAYHTITNIVGDRDLKNESKKINYDVYMHKIMEKLNKYADDIKMLEHKLFDQYEKERKMRTTGLFQYTTDKKTEYINIQNQMDHIEKEFSKIKDEINSNPEKRTQQDTKIKLEELREKIYTLRQDPGYNFLYNKPFSDTDKKLDKIQSKITRLLK